MKKVTVLLSAATLAISLGFSSGAFAQETPATPVPNAAPVQTTQPVENNNDFPWGLLGLLGLAGLAGRQRHAEPVRTTTGTVGTYEKN